MHHKMGKRFVNPPARNGIKKAVLWDSLLVPHGVLYFDTSDFLNGAVDAANADGQNAEEPQGEKRLDGHDESPQKINCLG